MTNSNELATLSTDVLAGISGGSTMANDMQVGEAVGIVGGAVVGACAGGLAGAGVGAVGGAVVGAGVGLVVGGVTDLVNDF
jgi:hypothetical protein